MYEVTPFLQPVPANPERAPDPVSTEEDLRQFRADRSSSFMGQLVREHLGMVDIRATAAER